LSAGVLARPYWGAYSDPHLQLHLEGLLLKQGWKWIREGKERRGEKRVGKERDERSIREGNERRGRKSKDREGKGGEGKSENGAKRVRPAHFSDAFRRLRLNISETVKYTS